MDQLAEDSCNDYRGFVRGHESFVPYFRAATPEQELGKLPLGSRPAKRRADGGLGHVIDLVACRCHQHVGVLVHLAFGESSQG